ncbi:MAG: hypothetical protein R3C28_28770 [Pirellulaceae bacterium]
MGFHGIIVPSAPGDGRITPQGGSQGKSFGSIDYTSIEQFTELNVGQVTSDLVIVGSDGNDRLFVFADGADSGNYRLDTNGVTGPLVPFSGITSLTFDANGGDDQLQIDHPTSSLFQLPGGVEFNGGAGSNKLNILDGQASDVAYIPTSSNSGTIDYGGVTALRLNGVQSVAETGDAESRTVIFASPMDRSIQLSDHMQPNLNEIRSNASFQLVIANPSALLEIDTASRGHVAVSKVQVSALDSAFSSKLVVFGDADDSVQVIKTFDSQNNVLPIDVGKGAFSVLTGSADFQAPVSTDAFFSVVVESTASFQPGAIVTSREDSSVLAGDILMSDGSQIESTNRNLSLYSTTGSVELSQLIAHGGTVDVFAMHDIDVISIQQSPNIFATDATFETKMGDVGRKTDPVRLGVSNVEVSSAGNVYLQSDSTITIGLADPVMTGIEAQGVVDIDYDNDLGLGGIIIQEGITSYAMEREAIRIKAWAGDPDPGLPTLPASIIVEPQAGLYSYWGGIYLESKAYLDAKPDSYITAAGADSLGHLSINLPDNALSSGRAQLLGSLSAKSATMSAESIVIEPSSSIGNTIFFLAPTEVSARNLSVAMTGLRSDIEFIPTSVLTSTLSVQGVASENAFSIRNQADGQSIGRVTNAATLPDASVRFRDGLDELSIWGDQSNDSFDVDTFANTSIHIEGLDPDVPTPGDRLYVSGANSNTTLSPEGILVRGNEVLTYTGIETAFVTDTLQIDVVGSVDDDTIEIDLSSPNGPKYLSFGSQAGTSVVMDQLPNRILGNGHGFNGDKVSWLLSDHDDQVVVHSLGVKLGLHDIRVLDVEQQSIDMAGGVDSVTVLGEQVVETTVLGGDGDDLFQVSPSRRGIITVDGESGQDSFAVDSLGSLATDTGTEIQVLTYDPVRYRNMESIQVGNNVGRTGDLNGDNRVDAADIQRLCLLIASDPTRAGDINHDNNTDRRDLDSLVHTVLGTHFGDANLDGKFDSTDLIQIFQAGEYEDNVAGNSTWAEGDWNCDGEFDTSDLIWAFQDGGYTVTARAPIASAVDAVFATTSRSRKSIQPSSALNGPVARLV